MNSLPPLASLQALVAVERTGAVQTAADVLSVTPSAVTHRLRVLEARLGHPVVAPRGRGLTLTARGRALLADIRPALETLSAAFDPTSEAKAHGPLRIAAAAGFASAWLCPRIAAFRMAHNGIRLTLSAGDDPEADIAVIFAEDFDDGAGAHLATPEFFPVCSPSLLHAAGGLGKASALGGQTILHLYDRRDWRDWAAVSGAAKALETTERDGGDVFFEDANLLLAAVVAGQGVALGDAITCARYLEEGALVRPFAASSRSTRSYFLDVRRATSAAGAFSEWLIAELASG